MEADFTENTMRTVFAAALALTFGLTSVCAHAQLRQCKDEAGHITITDEPCETPSPPEGLADEDRTPESSIASVPPASPAAPVPQRIHTSEPIRPMKPLAVPRTGAATTPRQFHVDTSTLQAARHAVLLDDQVRRQARLAGR